MSLDAKVVSDIVGGLYAAAVEPGGLEKVLGLIASAAEVASVSLIETRRDGRKSIAVASGFDAGLIAAYNSHFHACDRLFGTSADAPVVFASGGPDAVWPDFRDSELFAGWVAPNRIVDIGFVTVGGPGEARRSLVLAARSGDRTFGGGTQLALLALLGPHVERMSRFAGQVRRLERRCDGFLETLERLPYGVILLDRRGHVAHATRRAVEMVAGDPALRLSAQGLRAEDGEVDRRLRAAIGAAVAAADRMWRDIGTTALRIPRRETACPLLAQVMPFRGEIAASVLGEDAAMVLICDPARRAHGRGAVLGEVFDLTRAEQDVASRVVEGQGLAVVAADLGVSVSTIRTHLHRIFDKTGTRRQAELGRLIFELRQLDWEAPRAAPRG